MRIGLALDELEDVELHPDVVPRRGVKVVDNKVRAAGDENVIISSFA